MLMILRAAMVMSLLWLAACASATAAQSGITGQVTIGPTCPGPVRPGDTACADKPYQATFSVLSDKGKEVSRFQTDADGRFRVNLAPGSYTLHPVQKNVFPIAPDQSVTVVAGQYTEVQIMFDSGMR